MMPKGWEVKKLSELCEINPKRPSKPSDELVSFISMSQISEDGQIISTETKTYDEVSKGFTSFKDKDVLVAKITPCFENGKGALAHTLVNGIGFGSTEFHVLRAKETTDPKFIYYLTRTNAFRAKGTMNMQGSAGHRRVTTDFIQVYKINTPPLPEQQKIAKILSTWDKAISTTERLIENSTQQKKALMQQLLTGKKRLLDESGKRFEGEWERLKLEDVVIKTQLGTSERTKDVEETSTIPLIKMGNLTWGGFSFDKLETLPKSKVDESLILKSGDFLFNTRNTPELVGKSAVWKEQQVQATFDNNINRIAFNQNINTNFMCLYLTYGKGKSLISSLSAGSTSVAAIYWKDLKNIKLPVPTLSEQQKIATVLTNADKEIELLEQQLANLQQEKKALMQVLLTGKKRVLVDGEVLIIDNDISATIFSL